MRQEMTLRIVNTGAQDLVLIIEPWATEYTIPPGEARDVCEEGSDQHEGLEMHVSPSLVTLFGRQGGVIDVFKDGLKLP